MCYLIHLRMTDQLLTILMRNCLFLFFIHLKLELLTQFPASNDEMYFDLSKIAISNNELMG